MVFINDLSNEKPQKALIIGGGPVGMYTALKLLEVHSECRVKIIEKRSVFNRPHVVRFPFSAINVLPEEVKEQLWPNAETRQWTLGDRSKSDPGYWPKSYCRFAIVSEIGEFQKILKNYMGLKYKKRFEFEVSENFSVEHLKENVGEFDVVIIAAGNGEFTQKLRKIMNVSSAFTDYNEIEEVDLRGINLIYETKADEFFERCGKLILGPQKAVKGITYSHSNDSAHHVHIYTYGVGELRDIFAAMPETFKRTSAFSSSKNALTFDGHKGGENALTDDERRWFDTYTAALKNTLNFFDIYFPSDDKIKVFYSERYEYYYEVAAENLSDVPVLFIGDACGGTDYTLDLSLGRGLIAAKQLTDRMKVEQSIAFPGLVEFHNQEWKNVIATEFRQGSSQKNIAEIDFKYWKEGRVVDGKPIDREAFLEDFNRHCSI